MNATLDGQGKANGLGASFTGQLAADGTLAGTVSSRGPNLAVLLPAPSVPFRADGRLTVGSGLAAVDDLALEIGGSPASGAVALRVLPQQRLDIALSASRLDLDAWYPVLLRASTTIAGINVPIGLDFSAEAAPFGGGTLEHVRAAFDLIGNDLLVREASALLPGNGALQLSGRIARDNPAQARFEGTARLDAPVLRTTLRWLDEALPGALPAGLTAGLPSGAVQRLRFSADVTAGAGEVALRQLTGSMDDAPISGSISYKRGTPPSITADLTLDHWSIGAWLPARVPGMAELSRIASRVDAELRCNIRQTTLGHAKIDNLAVDLAIEAGSILLRRIEGTTAGARITASGMLGADGRLSNGKLRLVTQDAATLAELLPESWLLTPALWRGPVALDVQAAGSQEALTVGLRMALADASLEATPVIDLRSGEWSGPLTLRHPGARRLVATLGLPQRSGLIGLPAWLGDGSLSLVAHLAAARHRLTAEDFDLTAAALHASGKLALEWGGAEPRITGRVFADSLTVPVPNGASDVPLPFGVLHGWHGELHVEVGHLFAALRPVMENASSDLTVADDALRIERFAAKLGSGTVSGTVALDAAASPPALAAQARITGAAVTAPLADTPIDLLSGHVDASLQLAASGFSPSAILATLDGRVAVTVKDGTLSGFDLFRTKLAVEKADPKSAEAAARDALGTGATAFDQLELSADVAHGDLLLSSWLLSGLSGDARFAGGMNLARQTVDIRIALQPRVPNPPELAIHLTGPLAHPHRTLELANLARWMAEAAH